MDLLLAAFVQTLLDITKFFLLLTFVSCLGIVLAVAVTLLNIRREERRQRRFARLRQIHLELLADELRREDEIRVWGPLPREQSSVERRAS